MSDLPFQPAAITFALVAAGIVTYFAGVPYLDAAILLVAGVAIAGVASYRPARSPEPPSSRFQAFLRTEIANGFRLVIGASLIGAAAAFALRFLGQDGAG